MQALVFSRKPLRLPQALLRRFGMLFKAHAPAHKNTHDDTLRANAYPKDSPFVPTTPWTWYIR